MPTLTTTIEDVSPIISYQPASAWSPGTSSDNLADGYSQSSFTLTKSAGATATFTFNGTGVQIFGAKRGNHGPYTVNLDGAITNDNGQSTDPGIFQTSLFSTSNLPQGLHTVVLTNPGTNFLDIDFITWQSDLGKDSEQLTVNTAQDTDPAFNYQPSTQWSTSPQNLGSFNGGSGHSTSVSGASLTYTFVGDGVGIYGPVGPNQASFSVQMDGGSLVNSSATKNFYTPQVLLYRADNLGPGQHSLKITNQPTIPGQVLDIDFANVYAVPSAAKSISGKVSNSIGGGAIAGIVIAVFFIVISLIGLFFLLRSRRTKRRRFAEPFPNPSMQYAPLARPAAATLAPNVTVSPQFDLIGDAQPPPRSVKRPEVSIHRASDEMSEVHRIAAEAVSPGSDSNPGGSSHYSWASSSSLATRPGARASSSVMPSDLSRTPTTGRSASLRRFPTNPNPNSTSPRVGLPPRSSMKGRPPQLPVTANESLAQIPESELRANRMVVEGRPQDFGSVDSIAGPSNFGDTAPPDYSQATEQYNP